LQFLWFLCTRNLQAEEKDNFMIGFFDSGFGGLTVLKSVVELLPEVPGNRIRVYKTGSGFSFQGGMSFNYYCLQYGILQGPQENSTGILA